jgi:hypothetical protein
MLLEKAYAKVYGGYWNIGTGGFAEDALKDLTGAPTEFGQINDSTNTEELWKKLQYCDKKKYVMVVGSKGQGESKTESGIIEGHAYTLIGCHILNGQKVRGSKFFNPFLGLRNEEPLGQRTRMEWLVER